MCVGNTVLLIQEKDLLYVQWQTMGSIALENNWVYIRGIQCFVSEDHNISQQKAHSKAYEEKLNKLSMCLKK